MHSSHSSKTAQQNRSSKAECCKELNCESGLRNNYFEGKRLTADSFRVEQTYALERRRLLNRAIHGWGVVYGYAITAPPSSRVTIGPGLALDECGRELLQVRQVSLKVEDLIVLDEDGARIEPERALAPSYKHSYGPEMCWLLSVHYAEQRTSPVDVKDSCSCDHKEWDHTCETVRYSLRRIPCNECCDDFDCELDCDCGTGPCCEEHDDAPMPHKRGGCGCLCEHLTHLHFPECDSLFEIEEACGTVRVDLHHGVRLACIDITRDECDRPIIGTGVEACGPRRLVKRNDLLFDLIRGCDLTRIIAIGWKDWHRLEEAIPFMDFWHALGPDGEDKQEYVTEKFWVQFSRPVRRKTLRPDCFAMTVILTEREGGWWHTMRVPIVGVDTTGFPPHAGDPADHVRGATIVLDGAWVEDAVRGRKTHFGWPGQEVLVELEVRGDFIVDCNGQTVDANAAGLAPAPTGNGTLGGTFLSTFRVAVAPEGSNRDQYADRRQGVSS